MWPFNPKSTLRRFGALNGGSDWHCHVLPGVDDGVKSMRESLKILADYEELGVKSVWFTPHIMEDIPNTTDALRARFEELKEAYKGGVQLNLAAENMLDSLFEERLAARDLLPIGAEGNHLLVETSYYTPPMDLEDILQQVMSAGYYPLLAHPERYQYMELKDYDHLNEMGVKMQMNYTSLAGLYGPEPRNKAHYILKKGYYSACGTDLHRHRTLAHAFDASIARAQLRRLPSKDLMQ